MLNDKEKYIELAKKLNELANRGVDGEKINAANKLKQIMAKYNISLEDINEQQVRKDFVRYFKSQYEKTILIQIAASVIDDVQLAKFKKKTKKIHVIVKATPSELLLIESMFAHYAKAFEKEIEATLDAFIQVNRLFPKKPTANSDKPKMSPKEMDELVTRMAVIKKSNYTKQLYGKSVKQ